jgi:putative membrane protein
MRVLTWAIRLILFVFLVALAAKNVDPVTVHFYFDLAVRAPLVVLLFAAFLIGALFGVLALLGLVFRQRREISILKKKNFQATPAAPPA